jgi:hypothetical protein
MDFAFLPPMHYFPPEPLVPWIRIPVLPDATVSAPVVSVSAADALAQTDRPDELVRAPFD